MIEGRRATQDWTRRENAGLLRLYESDVETVVDDVSVLNDVLFALKADLRHFMAPPEADFITKTRKHEI